MNWSNIDLKSNYERDLSIIDSLTFDTLLLEISCNIRDINRETIKAQFEIDLKARIDSAREVFNSNLNNILNESLEYRNEN